MFKKLFSRKDIKIDPDFYREFQELSRLETGTTKRFSLDEGDFYPCLTDKTTFTGFDRHYVYHPAWAARIIRDINPSKHIDISSTLYFCSMLSAFIPVDFYDYRPARLVLDKLKSLQGDLLNLPFESDSVQSISCMHTIEHIGLARYGDPMDYNGDLKAVSELKRVVARDGHILFVVPLGASPRIFFNAHRIYTKQQVLEMFEGFELGEFALIPEDENDGGLIVDPSDDILNRQVYACGCFHFIKK
jgi:SAM-dependent methyltransferase